MIDGALRDRYMRDPLPIRLGNLSSSLGRLAYSLADPRLREMTLLMLAECKWFIEWTGPEAEIDVAAELAVLQVTLASWLQRLNGESPRALDVVSASQQAQLSAENVLQWSGLLGDA